MNQEKEKKLQEYIKEVKCCKKELLRMRIFRMLVLPILYLFLFIMIFIIPFIGAARIITNLFLMIVWIWSYFYIITYMFNQNKNNKIVKFMNNYSSKNYSINVRFLKDCIKVYNIYIKAIKEGRKLTSDEYFDIRINQYY